MTQSKLPTFQNKSLFEQALTHRSYANEQPEILEDNERLEFLGDAVLGFIIAEMLYTIYPNINEAQLTHLRARLVDEKQLGKLGQEFGLGELMRLGKGTAKDGGRSNPSLLNDAFEAILGAYFIDAGIEAAKDYVWQIFQPLAQKLVAQHQPSEVDNSEPKPQNTFIDSKNLLQQWALANYQVTPTYKIIAESGPDHAKQFTAQVLIKEQAYGTGRGRRKQEAEKRAAEQALQRISFP